MKIAPFLMLAALVAAPAFASSTALTQIQSDNPDASAYQVLQKLYDTSPEAASLADFDVFGEKATLQCAGTIDEKSAPVAFESLKKYVVVTPGTPSEGPLFPGTPDSKRTVLVSSTYESSPYLENISALGGAVVMSNTGSELVATLTVPTGYSDTGAVGQNSIRKNGLLLAVKIIDHVGTANATTSYAYCWR